MYIENPKESAKKKPLELKYKATRYKVIVQKLVIFLHLLKGTTEDEMVGWHHRLDGHEFEQALGVGDGQGSLECWGRKELDTTERLNWTDQSVNNWKMNF